MDFDVIVRGATLAPDDAAADIGIGDGLIAALEPAGVLAGSAATELNAAGLHVLPGGVDIHVHCNEPGRTEWEGFATASAALAVGGMTSFADMPLNAMPATINADAFDRKLALAGAESLLDFALWGGIVPGSLDAIPELHDRGVIGFKAFMCETGIEDFRPVDDVTLKEGMRRAGALDSIVAVHAEDEALTAALTARARAAGQTSARDYIATRPPIVELRAIERAIELAHDTGCRLHIVHVSTSEGVELVLDARARGVDVSWETTAAYLTFTADDVERIGPLAKCSPVMRDEHNRLRLWGHVGSDPHAIVTSDHSPAPPALKQADDFFAAWGGISGCQSTLGVMLAGADRISAASAIHAVTAAPAERFGLRSKGAIEVGRDADLALVELERAWTLEAADLRYRHRHSPFVGVGLRGAVRHVLARGEPVVVAGEIRPGHRGALLVPAVQN
jgi:allantoinase